MSDIRSLSLSFIAAWLAGCASFQSLQAGASTRNDVLAKFGPPTASHALDGGGETLVYPGGRLGIATWMVSLDADGKVSRVEQVRSEEGFARVQLGMDFAQVERLLGPPSRVTPAGLNPGTAWEFRYRDQWLHYARYNIIFDPDGRVRDAYPIREVVDSHDRH